jgi:TonB family protein
VVLFVLHFDELGPATPRLPQRRFGALTQLAASAALHASLVVIAAVLTTAIGARSAAPRRPEAQDVSVQRLVFLAPEVPQIGRGGGGSGNREPGRIRAAQGVGPEAVTLRVRAPRSTAVPVTPPPLPPDEEVPSLPSVLLEAKPLASGILDTIGLPTAGTSSDTATGSGSGGGVGTGTGTGVGPGHGSGLGAGAGGGTGGGIYRPGGAVSAPRLIAQVRPHYTNDALRDKIQGTVVLEAVVRSDGSASHIRVVSSLDRGGLDEEAVAAVRQWRFEPGRLAGEPVDVLVTIMVDFWIR